MQGRQGEKGSKGKSSVSSILQRVGRGRDREEAGKGKKGTVEEGTGMERCREGNKGRRGRGGRGRGGRGRGRGGRGSDQQLMQRC